MSLPGAPPPPEPGDLQLEIRAACPQCGGETRWGLLDSLNRCRFCDSTLFWPHSDEDPDYLVGEDRVVGREGLIDALAATEAMRVRSRIIANMAAAAGSDEASQAYARERAEMSAPPLAEIKRRIRPHFTIREWHPLYVPYLMASLTLAYHTLGRTPGKMNKVCRTLFYLMEDIHPNYPEPWNFRDQGLWLSQQRFRPLTAELLQSRPFLVPRDRDADLETFTRKWLLRRQILQPDLDPMHFEGRVAVARVWHVFRPFHLVEGQTSEKSGWFLVDGQFGSIAGFPDIREAAHWKEGRWEALDRASVRSAAIRTVPFRCPQCAGEVDLDPQTVYEFCRNCGRVLEATQDGLKPVPYLTLGPEEIPWWPRGEPVRTAWLPFWRVRGAWTLDGETFTDLTELALHALPALRALKLPMPRGGSAPYIPAFECWTFDKHDVWAFGVGAALTRAEAAPDDARMVTHRSVRRGDRVLMPTVDREDAEGLLPGILPSCLADIFQARMNPMAYRKLLGASFTPEATELLFVPIPVRKDTAGADLVLGPRGAESLKPLVERATAPALHRTCRRWLEKSKRGGLRYR